MPRNLDNSLIYSTAGPRREETGGVRSDIGTDYSEIAGLQLKDARTIVPARTEVGAGRRTKKTKKHRGAYMLLSMSPVKGFLAYANEVTKVERRMAISTELARGLKAARKAQGLSMDDLAAQAGLNQSMISRLESLAGNPTLDSLLRISEVLNVELGKLITEAETTVSTGVRRKKSN